jgi:hypothetical protein
MFSFVRLAVLGQIEKRFEADRDYDGKKVNGLLKNTCKDNVMIKGYLV